MNTGMVLVMVCIGALASLGLGVSILILILVSMLGNDTRIPKRFVKFFSIVIGFSVFGFLFASDK